MVSKLKKNKKNNSVKSVVKMENEIRDIINWLAVFKEEYDIPEEAVVVLRGKLEKLAKKISLLK
ncbi:MAG: hypothetical protein QXG86_01200 [Candidatus Woesearchaeota archaeon]